MLVAGFDEVHADNVQVEVDVEMAVAVCFASAIDVVVDLDVVSLLDERGC